MSAVPVERDLKYHDVCSLFPMMTDDEFRGLVDDIRQHGQHEPIWTYQGKIIDGRNRHNACKFLEVEPTFREWNGKGSLTEFVLSLNLHRRSLTASQRATIAVEAKKNLEIEIAEKETERKARRDKGQFVKSYKVDTPARNARVEAANLVKVNNKYVADAEKIKDASPETFERVKTGETTISEAKKELGLYKPPTGKTQLNGVMVDDPPEIAAKRAAGKIAPNSVVVIDDPAAKTSIEDIAEEIEEQNAKTDELTDDEWLAELPLHSILTGLQLKTFKHDALLYRQIESARRVFRNACARPLKRFHRLCSSGGAFAFRLSQFLQLDHPKNWLLCPASEDGGCGGTGTMVSLGLQCNKCYGRGYCQR